MFIRQVLSLRLTAPFTADDLGCLAALASLCGLAYALLVLA